jgi:uncharacterized protein
MMDIKVGELNTLRVARETDIGVYLDDGATGILLPKRFVPEDTYVDDELEVFVYHDNDGRPIATSDRPKAMVNEVAYLQITDTNEHGAFLDNGIMKDIFMHRSNMFQNPRKGDNYWVYVYLDRGRITATQRLDDFLNNDNVVVAEKEAVELVAYRKTEIGFVMMINKKNLGILHYNEIFQQIEFDEQYDGFVKKVSKNPTTGHTKIDLSLGKMGYQKVESESDKVIRLLRENENFLPFHDKSDPEDIYRFFQMSKKTFKMVIGLLYKEQKISIEKNGLYLNEA